MMGRRYQLHRVEERRLSAAFSLVSDSSYATGNLPRIPKRDCYRNIDCLK